MKRYRYLEEAEQELQEQIGYFDGVSRAVALRFVDAVEKAISEIRRHPQIGAAIGRHVRKRVLTRFPHSILYIDAADEIVIVAIAPGRRHPRYWRKRLKRMKP
ncbi:MAG TPA: type II toxin-antitoxin system RelE/ParE family toxin [Thermoanaerobaculia bacterium]|nr:type II toxin-antitoxin system RelE/ParE family toxin [Thermoanaerobaculia bacterium]